MSDNNYGYCNYCGEYRLLRWNGGYCSKKCYEQSGQQEIDAQEEADYQALWYSRTDFFSVVKRALLLGIQWVVIYFLMVWAYQSSNKSPGPLFELMFSIPFLVMTGFFFIVSIVQNILGNPKGRYARKLIFYGPQILMVVAFILCIKQ